MSGTWSEAAVVEPGNGTRYVLVKGEVEGEPFVCIPNFKRGATMGLLPMEHRYIMEKLELSEPDALVVLEWLRGNL